MPRCRRRSSSDAPLGFLNSAGNVDARARVELAEHDTRMTTNESPPIDALVVSGLTELALGALTGRLMAVAVSRPEDLKKLGIRSGARLRQWHLRPDHARKPDRRRATPSA